jgi:hypothetical protein
LVKSHAALAGLLMSAAVVISAAPASATIVMADFNTIQGEVLLFNSTVSGTTIQGHTNANTLVNFTGNTSLSNVIVGTGGQAVIRGPDIPGLPANDTYNLMNLSFSLATGTWNSISTRLGGRPIR